MDEVENDDSDEDEEGCCLRADNAAAAARRDIILVLPLVIPVAVDVFAKLKTDDDEEDEDEEDMASCSCKFCVFAYRGLIRGDSREDRGDAIGVELLLSSTPPLSFAVWVRTTVMSNGRGDCRMACNTSSNSVSFLPATVTITSPMQTPFSSALPPLTSRWTHALPFSSRDNVIPMGPTPKVNNKYSMFCACINSSKLALLTYELLLLLLLLLPLLSPSLPRQSGPVALSP
jgi:hypothetical protein